MARIPKHVLFMKRAKSESGSNEFGRALPDSLQTGAASAGKLLAHNMIRPVNGFLIQFADSRNVMAIAAIEPPRELNCLQQLPYQGGD